MCLSETVRLYHLISKEHGLDNLRRRRLKIAELRDLNDPFELVAADNSDREQRKIWKSWRKKQERKWGMLCFSKTWRNPVLWSHYADKHRGFCLGFEVDDTLLMPVVYTKKRLQIDLEALYDTGKLDQKLMSKLMRTKFSDWSYEKEVRVYAALKYQDPDSGLYFFDFNDEIRLTDVIVGPLSDVTEAEIRSTLSEDDANVSLLKARLAFQSFDVVAQKQGFNGGGT